MTAILAGSKSFVDAVQPQLQLRLGSAPEVASDPEAALQACAQSGGLLVFEHGAPGWPEVVRSIRDRHGPGAIAIIAVVSDGAAGAHPIESAGVDEVVRWRGRADPVLWAVDRVVARARSPVPPPPPRASAPTPAPGVAAREPALDIYDLGGTDAVSAGERSPPAADAPPPWPGAVPSRGEAEALLVQAMAGQLPPGDAGARVEAVLAVLSSLERSALAGDGGSVDRAALLDSAAQRLRVVEALATLPSAGAAVDRGLADRLLGDVDRVLGSVKALGASAEAPLSVELEAIRGALVGAGVELAGALSRLNIPGEAPTAAADAPATVPLSPTPKPAAVKVLSVGAEEPSRRRVWFLSVALGLSLIGGLAFHGWRASVRAAAVELPRYPGAPDGFITVPTAPGQTMLVSYSGRVDAEQLRNFKAQQELKGVKVQQIAPGTLLLLPEHRPDSAGTRSQGAQP